MCRLRAILLILAVLLLLSPLVFGRIIVVVADANEPAPFPPAPHGGCHSLQR